MDAPKIALPTEKQNGFLNGIERRKAFRLQEAKLQTNRSQRSKRSRSETPLSVQEENIIVKEKKTRGSARDHNSYRKEL